MKFDECPNLEGGVKGAAKNVNVFRRDHALVMKIALRLHTPTIGPASACVCLLEARRIGRFCVGRAALYWQRSSHAVMKAKCVGRSMWV